MRSHWCNCGCVVVGLAWVNLLAANIASAQCQLAKLTASDAAPGDTFGSSVSISENVILIGVPLSDDACPSDPDCNSGSAYVYHRTGSEWTQEKKLVASDAACGDLFGRSVSVSEDVAVVGAVLDDCGESDCGSAYVFRYGDREWSQEAKLTASDAAPWDAFGLALSANGNKVAIGAHNVGNTGRWSQDGHGAVYAYEFDGLNWTEQAKLVASDRGPRAWFGRSVSLDDNVVIIGASNDGDLAAGAAYVFRFDGDTWVEETKLTASDPTWFDNFGWSVSVSGDLVIVGDDKDDDRDLDYQYCDSGSAHVYRFDGGSWSLEAKLLASDAACSDQFGYTLSVDNDTVIVGKITDGHPGAAYVYRFDGISWAEHNKLTVSPVPTWFGRAVSVASGIAVVSAMSDDHAGFHSGSAFVFSARDCVSLREFAEFQNCFGGDDVVIPGCESWDSNSDGDVDLNDYNYFLVTLVR